jgi:hypothetical protein
MRTRHVVLAVAWTAMLAYYGWLKFVLLFVLICAGLFVGTVVIFGIWDAIRTRDRDTRQRAVPDRDEELRQLRQMVGLEK